MAEHLKREVADLIKTRFTHSDGRAWAEIPMAEAMGISQSQLNALRKGKNAGVGALLALSKHSGKSINELLGPSAPQPVTYDNEVAEILIKTNKLMRVLEKSFAFGSKSPQAKLRAEIQDLIKKTPYRHVANPLEPSALVDPTEKPVADPIEKPAERRRRVG